MYIFDCEWILRFLVYVYSFSRHPLDSTLLPIRKGGMRRIAGKTSAQIGERQRSLAKHPSPPLGEIKAFRLSSLFFLKISVCVLFPSFFPFLFACWTEPTFTGEWKKKEARTIFVHCRENKIKDMSRGSVFLLEPPHPFLLLLCLPPPPDK